MVWQKRLDYGFHGYQFPPTPRAARSARRRGFSKRIQEDSKVCAFDLLAIVAGDLLVGREPQSSSDSLTANKNHLETNKDPVKEERQDEEIPWKVETLFPERTPSTFFASELISQVHEENISPRESVNFEDHLRLGLTATVVSDTEEKSKSLKVSHCLENNEASMVGCKVEIGLSASRCDSQYGLETNKPVKNENYNPEMGVDGLVAMKCKVDDPLLWNGKPVASFDSGDFPQVPFVGKEIPLPYSYPCIQGDVHVVNRDDDENSSGCTYPRVNKKHFRPAPRIGDRRIRKILASRYWKVSPRLKETTHCSTDGIKPGYSGRKNIHRHQRSEKIYPFKKRKYFQCGSLSPSEADGVLSSDSVPDSFRQSNDRDGSGRCLKTHERTRASSAVTPENTSFQPRDSHVKLRIKSFRVPELFIEIPESETVGSLKRNVKDAVTAILGGGLRIGVLLKGKNVRDDTKTLLQSGISHGNHLDSVGFSLEPNPTKPNSSFCRGASPLLLNCDTQQPLSRYPPSASMVDQETGVAVPRLNNLGSIIDSDHDSAPSPVEISIDKSTSSSKALVAVPTMNVEALSVVPSHRKAKRSEMVQRRIRRPFTVAEVESLVQAVEKLGTGRWRDVKLRAFDNAKHRTYVDLKDKWKTLVHTARISPQQRRGEPVPQELLDRVLMAHAHWSQHQAKQQQGKYYHHPQAQPEAGLLLKTASPAPSNVVLEHV